MAAFKGKKKLTTIQQHNTHLFKKMDVTVQMFSLS